MEALTGRVAIITGGNSGIGKAIAKAYAAEGAKVVLAARRAEQLKEVADAIAAAGGAALAIPTDITKEAAVLALFEQTMAAHGRIDILINNAGTASREP